MVTWWPILGTLLPFGKKIPIHSSAFGRRVTLVQFLLCVANPIQSKSEAKLLTAFRNFVYFDVA